MRAHAGVCLAWNDERLHCQLVSNYTCCLCGGGFGGVVTTARCPRENSVRFPSALRVFMCTFITVKSGCSNKILRAGGCLERRSLTKSCSLLLFTDRLTRKRVTVKTESVSAGWKRSEHSSRPSENLLLPKGKTKNIIQPPPPKKSFSGKSERFGCKISTDCPTNARIKRICGGPRSSRNSTKSKLISQESLTRHKTHSSDP